jgi:biofilm protein TabA
MARDKLLTVVGLPWNRWRPLLGDMALFGPFFQVKSQASSARFEVALAYVEEALRVGSEAHARIGRVALGTTERIELAGGAFALEQAYLPKARPEGFFESHRRYIDVQVIVEGEELMEVEDIARLVVSAPYLPERDLIKYADTAVASVLRMRAGDVAIFYPEDGHMPSLHWRGTGLVRKTVVKVPV